MIFRVEESAVQSTSTNGKGTAGVPRMPAFGVLGWRASALPGTTHNDDYERMKRAPCCGRAALQGRASVPNIVIPSKEDDSLRESSSESRNPQVKASPRTGRARPGSPECPPLAFWGGGLSAMPMQAARTTTRARERAPYTFFEWKSRLKIESGSTARRRRVPRPCLVVLARQGGDFDFLSTCGRAAL